MYTFAQVNAFLNAHAALILISILILGLIMIHMLATRRQSQGKVRPHVVQTGTQNSAGKMRYHKLIAEGYEVIARTDKGVFTMRKFVVYA